MSRDRITGQVTIDLNNRKKLRIQKYAGKMFVDIREFYHENGTDKPTKKGISLSTDQWDKLKRYMGEIDTEIRTEVNNYDKNKKR